MSCFYLNINFDICSIYKEHCGIQPASTTSVTVAVAVAFMRREGENICLRRSFSEEFSIEFLVELLSTCIFLIIAYIFRNCMSTRAPRTVVNVETNTTPEISQIPESAATNSGVNSTHESL
uniref:Transmembrane protein n=1 Tax=Strongyloides venezuelensis TaxID=75913 RepID=A0A0K0G3G9_STRVS